MAVRAERRVGQVASWRLLDEAEERESEQSVPSAFGEQVRASPEALALVADGAGVSYDELDRRSNRVAAGILNESGGDAPVGFLVDDPVASAVALLGILKSGRIAVPLDPRAPEAALAKTLSASRSSLLLTGAGAEWDLPAKPRAVDDYARESDRAVDVQIDPGRGALLAFTSGSTGEPKGRLRTHRMTVHHARWDPILFGIEAGTRVALRRATVSDRKHIFESLLTGATLLLYDPAKLGAGLAAWLNENEAEIAGLMPSMIDLLLAGPEASSLTTLRAVSIGGEKAGRGRAKVLRELLLERTKLIHTYGSTETARMCCDLIESPVLVDETPLPVGFSVPGTSVSVRDPDGLLAERGEVVVESRYLSQVWNPDAEVPSGPAMLTVRTGDLGSVGPDGRLTILGRVDRMVKVRGFRVGLDTVEHALLGLAGVNTATVVDEPSPRGTRRLVAHVVVDRALRPEGAESLRGELALVLPGYMLPARVVEAESLPILPGGKLDLRAIAGKPPTGHASPPLSATEERLSEIWAGVLELDDVGRAESYLQLGGDSLSAAVITAQVYATFGVELSPRVLAETSTIASMAAAIEKLQAAPKKRRRPELRRARHDTPPPLGVLQETFLRSALRPGEEIRYNLASAIQFRGGLDDDAMMRAIEEIVRRHEVLRTTFSKRGRRWVQIVHPAPFLDLELIDFRDRADPAGSAAELLSDERATPFDLERGPLTRFRLVRTAQDEHQLLRIRHHAVSDPWSSRIFFTELSAVYSAYSDGRPSPLPELALQYGDYAAWERSHVRRRSRYFWHELSWWRRTLAAAPGPIPLPFVRQAPVEDAPATEGVLDWSLPVDVANALDRVERECSASYFVVRLATFASYLFEATGTRDIVAGIKVTPRQLPETQQLIGVFGGLTALRLRAEGVATLADWVRYVGRSVAETREHSALQYAAFPWAFQGLPLGVPSLDVIVSAERSVPPWESSPLSGLQIEEPDWSRPPTTTMPQKFEIQFAGRSATSEPERCTLRFDARRYDPIGVRTFLDAFARYAADRCARPGAPLFTKGPVSRPRPSP